MQMSVKMIASLLGIGLLLLSWPRMVGAQDTELESRVVVVELPNNAGRGAGVILAVGDAGNDTLILTAYHVLQLSANKSVAIRFWRNPTRYTAEIVEEWVDTSLDLAVIRVHGQSVPTTIRPAVLGAADSIQKLSSVTAIGHHVRGGNEEWLYNNGQVLQTPGTRITFSRTTADSGFSGGPLFNSNQVVGIVTDVDTEGGLAYAQSTDVIGGFLRGKHLENLAPNPHLYEAMRDFTEGIGPFRLGMTPDQINALLPKPFGDVSWTSLPIASEFRPAEVRYFWVPLSDFKCSQQASPVCEPLHVFQPCWGGQSFVPFLFSASKLIRVSLRLYPDCSSQVELMRSFAQEFGITPFNPNGPRAFEVKFSHDTVAAHIGADNVSNLDIYSNDSPQPQP